jgi:hypothetical protein
MTYRNTFTPTRDQKNCGLSEIAVGENKKAKKSIRPRASTGNTHYETRYAGVKLFSSTKIQQCSKIQIPSGISV